MRILKTILFLLSLSLFLLACGSGGSADKNNPILKEAFEYHQKTLQISDEFRPLLEHLIQEKNSLQVQGRALSQKEMEKVDAINSLEKSFLEWEANLMDVPGFGHSHDHGKCSHDHSNTMKLTPEQILEVQRESLEGIQFFGDKARECSRM